MSGSATATTGIPFVDLSRTNGPLADEMRSAYERVVERGDFILGEEVARFEESFAGYVGSHEAVGVGSGTAALTIGLRATGIGPGDEVIVPAFTFIASALAVTHAGATPVFCDVEEETGLIDLASAAAVATPRTAAVMAVHLYGQACDLDALQGFAAERGLALVEDAAQAHGAGWRGRRAGSIGIVSAFSFYPSKNLGAFGDAGVVCTGDSAVASRVRALRNLGQSSKWVHAVDGYNERLDTLQAAVLRIKLGHLDDWNAARRAAAARYRDLLPPGARPVPERDGAFDAYHLFPVRVPRRDEVRAALSRSGVQTGVHYPSPVHMQPPYKSMAGSDLPVASRWAVEELSLPMFAGLREDEVSTVCDRLEHAIASPAEGLVEEE